MIFKLFDILAMWYFIFVLFLNERKIMKYLTTTMPNISNNHLESRYLIYLLKNKSLIFLFILKNIIFTFNELTVMVKMSLHELKYYLLIVLCLLVSMLSVKFGQGPRCLSLESATLSSLYLSADW